MPVKSGRKQMHQGKNLTRIDTSHEHEADHTHYGDCRIDTRVIIMITNINIYINTTFPKSYIIELNKQVRNPKSSKAYVLCSTDYSG
jgi:rRNA pseudouridine-1189 N-methylase Emg1 (Nep1/Mra1 family)